LSDELCICAWLGLRTYITVSASSLLMCLCFRQGGISAATSLHGVADVTLIDRFASISLHSCTKIDPAMLKLDKQNHALLFNGVLTSSPDPLQQGLLGNPLPPCPTACGTCHQRQDQHPPQGQSPLPCPKEHCWWLVGDSPATILGDVSFSYLLNTFNLPCFPHIQSTAN